MDFRSLLQVRTSCGKLMKPNFALNEITLARKESTSMITCAYLPQLQLSEQLLGRWSHRIAYYGFYGLQPELWWSYHYAKQ